MKYRKYAIFSSRFTGKLSRLPGILRISASQHCQMIRYVEGKHDLCTNKNEQSL